MGEALGRSQGGFSTKLHLRAEGGGKPMAAVLTAGERHEQFALDALMDKGAVRRGRRRGRPRPRRRTAPLSISASVGRIIRFLAATGMHQEEAVSLEWSQVSMERREIRLTKTKTSSPRVVPLSDEALAVLTGTPRHITRHYVFWNGDGRRYTHFASQYRNIARRAGVPWRCHDLRHRFASVFLMETGDLAALQAILGHRTVAMTMRYSHLVTDHLHRAIAKLGTSLGTNTAESDEDRVGRLHLNR